MEPISTAIIASAAIGAGGSIAGGAMAVGAPKVQGVEKWQFALGALLNLPGFIQGLKATRQATEMGKKWTAATDPRQYLQRGWLGQEPGENTIIARTDMGLDQWLSGVPSAYAGLLER